MIANVHLIGRGKGGLCVVDVVRTGGGIFDKRRVMNNLEGGGV